MITEIELALKFYNGIYLDSNFNLLDDSRDSTLYLTCTHTKNIKYYLYEVLLYKDGSLRLHHNHIEAFSVKECIKIYTTKRDMERALS